MNTADLQNAVTHYLTMLDKARRVQQHAGNMGLDAGHMEELHEAEDALRQRVGLEPRWAYLRERESR